MISLMSSGLSFRLMWHHPEENRQTLLRRHSWRHLILSLFFTLSFPVLLQCIAIAFKFLGYYDWLKSEPVIRFFGVLWICGMIMSIKFALDYLETYDFFETLSDWINDYPMKFSVIVFCTLYLVLSVKTSPA
jgi:hypothetical protein